MNYIKLVEKFITDYYLKFCDDRFTYHNLEHVKNVLSIAEKIGKSYDLNNSEIEILKISAWFHDIGHFINKNEHEKISANSAKDYLEQISYPADKINLVIDCIMATEVTVKPKNILEKIIKDADLFHLGSSKYFEFSEKLFIEIKKRKICSIDNVCWARSSIKFFEKHKYYTNFAKNLYEKQKSINLEKLHSLVNKHSLVPE